MVAAVSTFEVSVTPSNLKRTQEKSCVRAKSSSRSRQRGKGSESYSHVSYWAWSPVCHVYPHSDAVFMSILGELLTFAMAQQAPAAAPPPVSGIRPPPPLTTETNVTENWKIFRPK